MNTPHIACFGELLIRLSTPDQQLLGQASLLNIHCGGAEANVAVNLARSGHRVSMLSLIPDNALGERCRDELRRHGVNTTNVVTADGRMGLYFLIPGAAQRPSQVIYDRANSAFATHAPELLQPIALLDKVDWLHVSGVTTALNTRLAQHTLSLIKTARDMGAKVSFDCNYRAKLWQAWNGDAAAIFRSCAALANVLFADSRSLNLMLGHSDASNTPAQAFGSLSETALKQFPALEYIACTHRVEHTVAHHELGARLRSRKQLVELEPVSIHPIVDRIGTGDAFAAGFLHALIDGQGEANALKFGLAAGCIKHSIHGDFNLASREQIELLRDTGKLAVQR